MRLISNALMVEMPNGVLVPPVEAIGFIRTDVGTHERLLLIEQAFQAAIDYFHIECRCSQVKVGEFMDVFIEILEKSGVDVERLDNEPSLPKCPEPWRN